MKHKILILTCIFIVTLLMRFWRLEANPPSMYWDEVSQGYNSYSILKTGRDEHGEFLPIARFKAFGDYKAPVYIYLDVPFIALFGKTTLGVRFPSALFGSLTVLLTYFLVIELFYKNEKKEWYALASSAVLAISPWHVQLSRAAYEGNIATFFTVLGVLLFFVAKRRNVWIFIASVVSFVFAFYAFNAHRVFIPLLVALLSIVYFDIWNKRFKPVLVSISIGVLLLIPFLVYLQTPESKLRFNEVNIFTNFDVIKQSNQLIRAEDNSLTANLLHNRRILFGLSYLEHYFDFFDPYFLFIGGDINPRFSMRDTGQLYLWQLPLLLIGIYCIARYRNKESIVLFGWFLLAPIAAATARETPHALRAETFIPLYSLFTGVGIVSAVIFLKKLPFKIYPAATALYGVFIALSVFLFLYNYHVHYPHTYYADWQYGYKETIEKVEKIKDQYDYVVFTSAYGRPHIYALFYSTINPSDYPRNAKVERDAFGFYNVRALEKYRFRESIWESKIDSGKKVLYVVTPREISGNFTTIDRVKFPDGTDAFVLGVK